jgi:single stranded DNA-binding protein
LTKKIGIVIIIAPLSMEVKVRGIATFQVHGRVGIDPEMTTLANGTSRVTSSVAVNVPIRDGDEWRTETIWFRFAWFGKTAERIADTLRKGQAVVIHGDIRSYKTQIGDREINNFSFRPRITSIIPTSIRRTDNEEIPANAPVAEPSQDGSSFVVVSAKVGQLDDPPDGKAELPSSYPDDDIPF